MKKLIITCALGISASFAFAQAVQKTQTTRLQETKTVTTKQQGPSAEVLAERRAKTHQQQLGLNAAQYQSVYKAELDYLKKDQAVKASGREPGPGESMQMEMTKDQQIKAAVTPDQFAKYEATKPKPGIIAQPLTPATR